MEAKKQRIFYLVSFFLIGIVFWTLGKDAAVSGHYQRASCSDTACAAVFLCVVGTGNLSLSVYLLRGIIHAAAFILCEREKLAQLVSGEYAAQESAEIGKISSLDNRDSNASLFQQHDNADYIGQRQCADSRQYIWAGLGSFYHERVSRMQSGMITFMAEVVENRDDNTGGHIRRTAEYVERIAKELKRQGTYSDILTDRYMSDMVVAAPLHDIGKIHIPDAVLNKPGKLTEEEFEIMKTHTTAGEELLTHAKVELGESEYLNTAVEMAAYHHEWWNGKGYPYGISGEKIPLCARIMAVADVFDELTSKRCYKNAMPLEKAYAIIREESGTHFDPAVVEAFIHCI